MLFVMNIHEHSVVHSMLHYRPCTKDLKENLQDYNDYITTIDLQPLICEGMSLCGILQAKPNKTV